MPTVIPERIRWTIETLAIRPSDQLLEIGGGPGVSATLACEKLEGGSYVGLDRSAVATERATQRNHQNIKSGKASFLQASLANADFGGARFDKMFAINVNLFWIDAQRELSAIRTGLNPRGRLFIVYEPPAKSMIADIVKKVRANLQAGGFVVSNVLTEPRQGNVVCIEAALASR